MTDIAVIDPSLHAEAGGDRQQNNDHAGVAEKSAAAGTAGEAFERSEADAAQQQGSEAHSGSFEVVGRNQSATSLAEVTSSKLHSDPQYKHVNGQTQAEPHPQPVPIAKSSSSAVEPSTSAHLDKTEFAKAGVAASGSATGVSAVSSAAGNKPEAEPRLSHARLAVPGDPGVKPYGCNSLRCIPSYDELDAARSDYEQDLAVWRAEYDRLQADPATAGQRPSMRHPSLYSIGVCFAASRDLLEHLRDEHQMRQKGEVHVSQLNPNSDNPGAVAPENTGELGEDGKMFRCALIGCQRTWKNANGLQYHCLTSVNGEEHNIDAVNRRRPPPAKRKKEGSDDGKQETDGTPQEQKEMPIFNCPYHDKLGCKRQYKHRGGVKHHLEGVHRDEPDYEEQIRAYQDLPAVSKKPRSVPPTPEPLPASPQPPPPSQQPQQRPHEAQQQQQQQQQQRQQQPHHQQAPQQQNIQPPQQSQAQPRASATQPQSRVQPPQLPTVPHSGMYTHGYIFSATGQPYRPRGRPLDALFFLNTLSTSGVKTHQARASERLLVNALLNAEFIKGLQDTANSAGLGLDLFDEDGMVAPPAKSLHFPDEDKNMPFTKGDVDRAILKLAASLHSIGFGDGF